MLIVLLFGFFSAAAACGGFFCSLAAPVQQGMNLTCADRQLNGRAAGENILFSMKGDVVTATIQIQYSGPAEEFSWVLPLPSQPHKFGVSSDILFSALHRFTDPTFTLDVKVPEGCSTFHVGQCFYDTVALASSQESTDKSQPKVEILDMGEVGPFVYTVIKARDDVDPDGTALFEWLNENGFDQPPSAQRIVTRYVKNQHRFVTLKLQKGKSAGELAPIVMEYKSPSSAEMSCIPLRLTAVAATDNMPIYVWIAGDTRAVPNNFVHVVPDLRQMDWSCASTLDDSSFFGAFGRQTACDASYRELLRSTAADYGIDRWMTTEFAGAKPDGLLDAIWNVKSVPFTTGKLRALDDPGDFLLELLRALQPLNLQRAPQTQALLRSIMPMPSKVDDECKGEQQFYSLSGECVRDYVDDFDGSKAADRVQTELIDPIIAARKHLSEYSYLTRLFTTISPQFMNRDPIFRFVPTNAKLGDVSNAHKATLNVVCPAEATATTGTLVFDDKSTVEVEQVTSDSCGKLSFRRTDGTSPPIYTPVVQIVRTSGPSDAPVLDLQTFADSDEAVKLDATLMDDVVGLAWDADQGCNAGSKDCECAAKDMCSNGLVCQSVQFQKVCVIDSGAAGVMMSMALAAVAIALLAL